jgi:ABC-2 type transport system ATP-binding protein
MSAIVAAESLTKRFGNRVAVEDLSFSLEAGSITGFLGPNGAGKNTTLHMLLGLTKPTRGRALLFGRPYARLSRPSWRVGAMLEAADVHPGRSGRDHLLMLSRSAGLADTRVDRALRLVELDAAATRRVKSFSLGMRQRLGLASALLGDPEVLILDEPTNGLDPEGMRWLRTFLRSFAEHGGTVLVSSHGLAELAQTVDQVVIINHGRLVIDRPLDQLIADRDAPVRARTPQIERLMQALLAERVEVTRDGDGGLLAFRTSSEQVGAVACAAGIPLSELVAERSSLEGAFLGLTSEMAS